MRHDLVSYLKSFIGSRYSWGAEGGFNTGFDCSGLVLEGLRSIGKWGHSDSSSQGIYNFFERNGGEEVKKADIGDILYFGKDDKAITHIGIMINNYQYIEAGGGGKDTVDKGMVRLRTLKWRKDLVGIHNIFGKEV